MFQAAHGNWRSALDWRHMLGVNCPVLQSAAISLSFVSQSLDMEEIPPASITIGVRLLS